MKKTVYILIVLVLSFLIFEWGTTFFKKGHEISYKIYASDITLNIKEVYQKENGDNYLITIQNEKEKFEYIIKNNYNKQKKIIKKIEYFKQDENTCIYPILNDDSGTYLECNLDNKIYTASSNPNQIFISNIEKSLREKGYQLYKANDTTNTKLYNNSTIYTNNIISSDLITLWTYKGINIISNEKNSNINILGFDKYENSHGFLVGNYYIIPNYLSSRVLEFSKVSVINLDSKETKKIDLGYTLSSDSYMNGVIDNKLYYTDPSNLLQIEINPEKENARLIGSKNLGGQIYNGNWQDANIYDFVSNKILFKNEIPDLNISYVDIIESNSNYYFYNNKGEVYQILQNDLNNAILLFKTNGINNFNVIENTIYYVSGDTLYYYNNEDGIIPVLKNNDLLYNTTNRIDIYRKS